MGIAISRKAIAFFVTALLMMGLRAFGMEPAELDLRFGVSFAEAQEFIVDAIVTIGIPTFMGWLQPNEIGDSIMNYWKIGVAGLVGIMILAVAVWLL